MQPIKVNHLFFFSFAWILWLLNETSDLIAWFWFSFNLILFLWICYSFFVPRFLSFLFILYLSCLWCKCSALLIWTHWKVIFWRPITQLSTSKRIQFHVWYYFIEKLTECGNWSEDSVIVNGAAIPSSIFELMFAFLWKWKV